MGLVNSTECRIFCEDFLCKNTQKGYISSLRGSFEKNLSKHHIFNKNNNTPQAALLENRELFSSEFPISTKETKIAARNKVDESTLPNLEITKDFKNNTLSEKNLTFENKYFNNSNANKYIFSQIEDKISKNLNNADGNANSNNKVFVSYDQQSISNLICEQKDNEIHDEASANIEKKKNLSKVDEQQVNNNLIIKDKGENKESELSQNQIFSRLSKYKIKDSFPPVTLITNNCSSNNYDTNTSLILKKATLAVAGKSNYIFSNAKTKLDDKLKEKLFLDLNKINKPNPNNNTSNNYIESDRSNKSNYLMISIGEYRDGLENISNIRVGKSFSSLIKEFNSIIKIYFSNLKLNTKFDINLIHEEKENYSIKSNKISDYNSNYSLSFSNDFNSNFNSFNKSKSKEDDFISHYNNSNSLSQKKHFNECGCHIQPHSYLNGERTGTGKGNGGNKKFNCISDFSGDSQKTRKRMAKKIFTHFKNLIFIPVISISGEIKNSFTIKKSFSAEEEKIHMNELSIKMPYFDNLFSFFLNFLENCKYQANNHLSNSNCMNNSTSKINKNQEEFFNSEYLPDSKQIKSSLNGKQVYDNCVEESKLNNSNVEDIDSIHNVLKEIYLKEKQRSEAEEIAKISEKLEFYFKLIKTFCLLETKINLNPNTNSVYLSFLNIIRINDIISLIKKINFPNQDKFCNIIKLNNLYLEEVKLNLKQDKAKLVIGQFQKNNNLKNFKNKLSNLLALISQMTEVLINKQLQINIVKKLFYEKEAEIFTGCSSQNLQIFLNFNIEKNFISQIGILKEKNISSIDFNFLVKDNNSCNVNTRNNGLKTGSSSSSKLSNNKKDLKLKNIKLKKEYFILDFIENEEEFFHHLNKENINNVQRNENKACLSSLRLNVQKAEFETFLIADNSFKILREYDVC